MGAVSAEAAGAARDCGLPPGTLPTKAQLLEAGASPLGLEPRASGLRGRAIPVLDGVSSPLFYLSHIVISLTMCNHQSLCLPLAPDSLFVAARHISH